MAAAVRTNRPAPMMAPIPRDTSAIGPRDRFSDASPVDEVSVIRESIDLVRQSEPATRYPRVGLYTIVTAPAEDGMTAARGQGSNAVVRRLARDLDVVGV